MNQFTNIAVKIFNDIADGKDGTLDVQGYDLPTSGYFVGGDGEALVFDSLEEANRSTGLRKITEFVENTSARFVGWWTDSETGKVYVDGTTWHTALATAMHAAVEREEIAFWDITCAMEIRTIPREA